MPPASPTGRETPPHITATPPQGTDPAFEGSIVPPALMERWRELTVNAPVGDLDPTLGRVMDQLAPGALENVPEGVVALGDPIARGGMGEVRRGTQHRLRREVAVKRALRQTAAAGRSAMLREAWVAASLEHPNILPIHTLTREGDEPLIVMKRVEGRVWSDMLEDERDPGSPTDLRLALEHFIEHRDVNGLLDESFSRLDLLAEDLARTGPVPRDTSMLRRVENECRFGLEEALARWPENTRAQEGLHDLARLTVRRALRAGDWRAAGAALERLPAPDAELLDQVGAARDHAQSMARERAILEDLGSHEDMLRFADLRSKVCAFISVGWTIWFFCVGATIRSGAVPLTYVALLTNAVLTCAIYGGIIWSVRDTLHSTQIDRRVIRMLGVCFVDAGIVWLFAMLLDLPPLHAVALSSSVYVFFFIATATVIDRRLAWIAPVLAPVALLPLVDVRHVFEWQGAYVLLGGVTLSLIWRRDARLAREQQALGRRGT